MTNTKDILVSVVVPAYNAAAYIEQTIRSVMAQTHTCWEMLVIDDGSTDDTVRIVERLAAEDHRIRWICNPQNSGVATTRNRGLELCEGAYVAFLDSDDTWHPEKLALQLQKAVSEQAALVYTAYAIVDVDGQSCRAPYRVPARVDFKELLKENVIGCSTVLLDSIVAKQYRFLADFYHEDYCLWLDILRDGHTAVGCTDVLTNWRLITTSRSFNKKNGAKKRWRIYRDHLHFSVLKSARYFVAYAFRGWLKYLR